MSEQNPSADLPPAPQAPQPPQPPQVPQQSFGAAPPAPGGSESFGSAPQSAETVGEAPAKKKGGVGKIVGVIVAVVVAVCIGGGFFLVRNFLDADATKEATAGSCIANLPAVAEGEDKEANDATVVDCTDATAAYKVEGRLEGKTEDEAKSETICAAYPTAEFVYRAIPAGGTGYVLCLSQITK